MTTEESPSYYKFLKSGRQPTHGRGVWTPGMTRSVSGELVPCQRGIHFCKPQHLSLWISDELWTFEDLSPDETIEHEGSKMVTRKGRIVERVEAWTPKLAQEFCYHAANLALADAAGALVSAGVRFDPFPAVCDEESAMAARDVAWAAGYAAEAAGYAAWATRNTAEAAAAGYAAWAARNTAEAASDVARVARNTAEAAGYAAMAAGYAAWAAGYAAEAAGYAAWATRNTAEAASDVARAASYASLSAWLAKELGL